jgi:hypothetical protein
MPRPQVQQPRLGIPPLARLCPAGVYSQRGVAGSEFRVASSGLQMDRSSGPGTPARRRPPVGARSPNDPAGRTSTPRRRTPPGFDPVPALPMVARITPGNSPTMPAVSSQPPLRTGSLEPSKAWRMVTPSMVLAVRWIRPSYSK